jgi:hypothetical protein
MTFQPPNNERGYEGAIGHACPNEAQASIVWVDYIPARLVSLHASNPSDCAVIGLCSVCQAVVFWRTLAPGAFIFATSFAVSPAGRLHYGDTREGIS